MTLLCAKEYPHDVQVSAEWAQAKSEASQAKAAGDKNKQKSIGLVIRSLKQEMKELGQSNKAASGHSPHARGYMAVAFTATVSLTDFAVIARGCHVSWNLSVSSFFTWSREHQFLI